MALPPALTRSLSEEMQQTFKYFQTKQDTLKHPPAARRLPRAGSENIKQGREEAPHGSSLGGVGGQDNKASHTGLLPGRRAALNRGGQDRVAPQVRLRGSQPLPRAQVASWTALRPCVFRLCLRLLPTRPRLLPALLPCSPQGALLRPNLS